MCVKGPDEKCFDSNCLKCNQKECFKCISNYQIVGNQCLCKAGYYSKGKEGC